MKIGIAGIGGIGSNVARHLAQAGVLSVKIVDFDSVEIGNLNRQFFRMEQVGLKKTDCLCDNLHGIFPEMQIETVDKEIGSGDAVKIFQDCSLVVEGFDHTYLKKMLVEELLPTGKRLVSASGIAGTDITGITVRRIGNCHVVGDMTSDQAEHILFPPKIALVAAIMAAIVLKYTRKDNNEIIPKRYSKGDLRDPWREIFQGTDQCRCSNADGGRRY